MSTPQQPAKHLTRQCAELHCSHGDVNFVFLAFGVVVMQKSCFLKHSFQNNALFD
jgi:hypothetical protein